MGVAINFCIQKFLSIGRIGIFMFTDKESISAETLITCPGLDIDITVMGTLAYGKLNLRGSVCARYTNLLSIEKPYSLLKSINLSKGVGDQLLAGNNRQSTPSSLYML